MARTAITPQTINKNKGAAVTWTNGDSANNMMFVNDGNSELIVKNGGGSTCNVTVHSVPDPYGRSGDLTQVVAAGAEAVFPVLDPLIFNQTASDVGNVYVDLDEATSVSVAVIRRG